MVNTLKKSLLDIVKEILIAMDSDDVNAIADTDEATDVANIVQSVYFDMVSTRKIPEISELILLTGLADSARPTYLKIPSTVKLVTRLDYDVATTTGDTDFRSLIWCDPDKFLDLYSMARDTSDTTSQTMLDINGSTTLIIKNDVMPHYFTSFDNEHIVCDSFDSSEDTTLQGSKTRAYAVKIPTFDLTDTFIPDLEDAHFRWLVQESKSTAIAILSKTVNPKVESHARKQRMLSQNDKYRIGSKPAFSGYGRN